VAVLCKTLIVGQPSSGGIQGGEDLEVERRINGPKVEVSHFTAGGAVAFVDP
jgi:hypothetical protein